MMGGTSHRRCALGVALGLPGITVAVLVAASLVALSWGASNALPLGLVSAITLMWLGLLLPLALGGYYIGIRRPQLQFPVCRWLDSEVLVRRVFLTTTLLMTSLLLSLCAQRDVSSVARAIPTPRSVFRSLPFGMGIVGLLVLAPLYIELFFIFNAMWFRLYYNAFGFLLIAFILMTVRHGVGAVLTGTLIALGVCWLCSGVCGPVFRTIGVRPAGRRGLSLVVAQCVGARCCWAVLRH